MLFIRCLILYCLWTQCAMAEPYQTIYIFGDSYSDTGARFLDSNGPTAVAYLAEHMSIVMSLPRDEGSVGRSINFAASGAVSGAERGQHFKEHYWCCQGMLDQVGDFVQRVHSGSVSFEARTTLFFIAGGLNDKQVPTEATVHNLSKEITMLKEVGAYHITLALLPTKIPAFSAVGERLNPAYVRMVAELRDRLNVDLRLNHWGTYFDEVMENAPRFGIFNTTSRCAGRTLFNEDSTPCSAPETYYYYHDDHPSTAVSRIVGEKLYDELIAAPVVELRDDKTRDQLRNDARDVRATQ